jgi:hypothetical protein
MLLITVSGACSGSRRDGQQGSIEPSSAGVSSAPTVRVLGRPAGFGQDNVGVKEPITVSTLQLCVQGASVPVAQVHLDGPRGMKLVDWGSRIWRSGDPGGQPGIATKLGQGFTHGPLDAQCPSTGRPATSFVLTVERTGRGLGVARSYSIIYQGGVLTVPFGIALCPAKCTRSQLSEAGA